MIRFTHQFLFHLSGRVRMGDPRAAAFARQILERAMKAPSGHRHRDIGRYLAYLLKARVATRAAFLPQKGSVQRTRLAKRLAAIFRSHGGQIHLTHTRRA